MREDIFYLLPFLSFYSVPARLSFGARFAKFCGGGEMRLGVRIVELRRKAFCLSTSSHYRDIRFLDLRLKGEGSCRMSDQYFLSEKPGPCSPILNPRRPI